MTWDEMCHSYPNEWVVVIDYKREGPVEVSGTVVAHGPEKSQCKDDIASAIKTFGKAAVRYTGELIQESDLPLLWQLSRTA